MKTFVLCFLFAFTSIRAAAAGEDHHDESFKVSEVALEFLGIKTMKLRGAGNWVIPQAARVRVRDLDGIYKKSGGSFVFVSVRSLREGDEIAIHGVTYLRMIEADSKSGDVGHGH